MTSNYDILSHILTYHVRNYQAYGGFMVQVSTQMHAFRKLSCTKHFHCLKVFSHCFASLKNKCHICEFAFC